MDPDMTTSPLAAFKVMTFDVGLLRRRGIGRILGRPGHGVAMDFQQ